MLVSIEVYLPYCGDKEDDQASGRVPGTMRSMSTMRSCFMASDRKSLSPLTILSGFVISVGMPSLLSGFRLVSQSYFCFKKLGWWWNQISNYLRIMVLTSNVIRCQKLVPGMCIELSFGHFESMLQKFTITHLQGVFWQLDSLPLLDTITFCLVC